MNKVIRMAIPLALLAVTPLQAQDIALGFKGGINIAKQDLNVSGLTLNLDSRTGFVGGAFATIGLGTTLFLQPEALYSSKGFKIDVSDFGLDFGASLAFELSSFDLILDGRYALGLTNAAKDATGDDSLKNRAWQFMVGFGFPLK
jgi:hypothetical protein